MPKALRWLVCFLPPAAFIVFQEAPDWSGLDGINAAALIVISPFALAIGYAITFVIVMLTRWLGRRLRLASRVWLAILMLALVALFSPLFYLEGDWLLLGFIELASLPAALLLTRPRTASPPNASPVT
jgi:hypothetical protein